MSLKVLVVLPHPDDEAFGASGTLSRMAAEGAHITYACLTLGEMGRNMGVPPFASRITLPSIRKKELEEAARIIGIQDLRMLGFHDKMVEFEEHEVLDRAVGDLIDELQPELIITFYPGYSVHPDHDATGASVIRTVQRMSKDNRPVVHCIAFSHNCEKYIGEPDIISEVSQFLPQKMAAIQSHRSQFQAPELVGGTKMTEEQIALRFGTETFWTYPFA